MILCSTPAGTNEKIGEEIKELSRQLLSPDIQQLTLILLACYRDEAMELARSGGDLQWREDGDPTPAETQDNSPGPARVSEGDRKKVMREETERATR